MQPRIPGFWWATLGVNLAVVVFCALDRQFALAWLLLGAVTVSRALQLSTFPKTGPRP